MTDPRDFERRTDMDRRVQMERARSPAPWGWIAGAVVVIVILLLVFAGGYGNWGGRNEANPPTTTGMAPSRTPSSTPPAATPPAAQPPAGNGQGTQQR
jgi:cytochrome c-type biogenesis protein CcmH/NrfG